MRHPRLIVVSILLLLVALKGPVQADTPIILLKDINPTTDYQQNWFNPAHATHFASTSEATYFVASNTVDLYKRVLWRTDGTDAGTTQITLESSPQGPLSLTALEDRIIYNDYHSLYGQELWGSDGTPLGTNLIKDIYPGPGQSQPRSFTRLGTMLLFVATTPQGVGLWRTDGTAAQTVEIKNIDANPDVTLDSFTTLGDVVYFRRDTSGGSTLWRSDGTVAGTYQFDTRVYATLKDLTVFNGALFFRTHDDVVWRSDGTMAGTDPAIAGTDIQRRSIANLTPAGNRIFFTATDPASNHLELWQTNGISNGTALVMDFNLTVNSAFLYGLTAFGDQVIFPVHTPALGSELWVSDGSTPGTMLLKDIAPGSGGSYPANIVIAHDRAFFYASSAIGYELWQTDGTTLGTRLVKDINPGPDSSITSSQLDLHPMTIHNGHVYLSADDGTHGMELWMSDGSEAGTRMIERGINPAYSYPEAFTRVDNLMFFTTTNAAFKHAVWVSDGTPQGTVPILTTSTASPLTHIAFKHKLYTMIKQGDEGGAWDLWESDGSQAGTRLVKSFNEGPIVGPFVELDDHVYFHFGQRIWRSDGTAEGTVLVDNRAPGAISHLSAIDGRLYFIVNESGSTCGDLCHQVWTSDGTTAGTVLLKAFDGSSLTLEDGGSHAYIAQRGFDRKNILWRTDGTASSTIKLVEFDPPIINMNGFTRVGDQLYWHAFILDVNNHHDELWTSDGSINGTRKIMSFATDAVETTSAALGDRLVFKAANQLWITDGTLAGTLLLSTARPQGSFHRLNEHIYFNADDGVAGIELWRTNGTSAGTSLFKDIAPGSRSSYASSMFLPTANGHAVFYADDGAHGYEPWETDGTPAGTRLLQDLYPGVMSSNQYSPEFGLTSTQIFIRANNGSSGMELWGIPFPPSTGGSLPSRVYLPVVRHSASN
jgi:ELWxxDGT repeat protein